MTKRNALVLFLVAAIGITVLDLWTKAAVADLLNVRISEDHRGRPVVDYQERFKILDEYFWLEYTYNYGAFSGWFRKHTGVLAILSAVALVVIAIVFIVYWRKVDRPELLMALPLGLLWGGTCGNFYDRAMLSGVRDWIRWFIVVDGEPKIWPNFNIADSAICVSVVLLILREFAVSARARRTKRESTEAPS